MLLGRGDGGGPSTLMRVRIARVSQWVGVWFFVFFGGWSFVAPRSFFDVVAPWEPYNEHFLHDAGAFSVGLGIGLLVAFFERSPAALAGAAGGAVLHALAHILDYGDGGATSDPYVLSALAVLLVAGTVVQWRTTP